LAIQLGHLLRNDFSDGIFWFRLDTTKIQDIFVAIAHLLGENLPKNNSIEIMASFIRSILAQRRILLILDNVEKESKVYLLLPPPSSSTIIILSKQKNIYLPANIYSFSIQGFTEDELLMLFVSIFNKEYVVKYKQALLNLAQVVGYLPLAVHLLAKQLKFSSQSPEAFYRRIKHEQVSLRNIWYENKNLYLAFNVSYQNLSKEGQAIFLSLGVFEGKDFSVETIAYMNGLSEDRATNILDELYNASLIDESLNNRYRIHPMTKKFIAEKMNNPYIARILQITFLLFGFFTIFWFFLQTQKLSYNLNYVFGSSYFVIPLWGSLWGFYIARKWGVLKSILGKLLLLFSFGLFLQTLGQNSYTYYDNFLHIVVPYPSLGDVFYFGCIIVYGYAVYLLSKISGVTFDWEIIKRHIWVTFFSVSFL